MTFTTEAPPGSPGTGDDYGVRVPHGSPDDVSPGVGDLDGFRGMRGASRDRAFLAVECEIRRLRAVQARMVTEVNQSGSFLDDGHRSPTNWVQAVTNSSRPSAITITDTAKLIERLPTLAAAFHTGQIGTDQIKLLTKLNTNPRCRDRLPESEQLLLDCARTLTYHDFRRACQRWQNHADPDGAHRDHETSHRNRRVSTATVGAGHILHAEGDALSGDIIGDILNQHTESEFHRDIAERAARYGDQANQHPLARTSQQRRYDALMTIFLKAAAGADQPGAPRSSTSSAPPTSSSTRSATSSPKPAPPAHRPAAHRLMGSAQPAG